MSYTQKINKLIQQTKERERGWSADNISDGWHTFGELYYHRMILFLALQQCYANKAWKSKQHSDGTMFENSFIVGMETPEGTYTYHYDLEFWELFDNIPEIEFAPEYDGHKPEDITRLLSLAQSFNPPPQIRESAAAETIAPRY